MALVPAPITTHWQWNWEGNYVTPALRAGAVLRGAFSATTLAPDLLNKSCVQCSAGEQSPLYGENHQTSEHLNLRLLPYRMLRNRRDFGAAAPQPSSQ